MSAEIKNLSPQPVWGYFYDLTQIPRPTGHMEAVTRFMVAFGKGLGLETLQDEVGNVLIRKPASPGMEGHKTVTMQSHLDMVPQKNSSVKHDFLTDPIDAYIDGDWVKARETTLGADNGMGAAFAMAVLADKTLTHGPLEALFTINEEVGMDGAFRQDSHHEWLSLAKGERPCGWRAHLAARTRRGCRPLHSLQRSRRKDVRIHPSQPALRPTNLRAQPQVGHPLAARQLLRRPQMPTSGVQDGEVIRLVKQKFTQRGNCVRQGFDKNLYPHTFCWHTLWVHDTVWRMGFTRALLSTPILQTIS